MGNSDSPINTGGNTNHLFYTGFRVKVVAPKNCAPIVYDANGGTIKGQATYTDAVASTGTSITTRTSLLTEEPIRDGYTFVNWTNSTTLLGTTYTYTYKPGANVSVWTTAATTKTWEQLLETNTFKAVWAPKYSLRYDANGGSTTPPSVEGNFEVDRKTGDVTQPSVTKTAADAIARDGYTFKGWKDQASGEEFTPGDAVELTTANPNRVLVAQWEQNVVPTPTPTTPAPSATTPAPIPSATTPTPVPSTSTPRLHRPLLQRLQLRQRLPLLSLRLRLFPTSPLTPVSRAVTPLSLAQTTRLSPVSLHLSEAPRVETLREYWHTPVGHPSLLLPRQPS